MNQRWLVAAVVLLRWTSPSVAPAQTAEEILNNVKQRYDGITDAEVQFSQTVTFSVSKVEQHTAGTLLMKKENKYRVEFDGQTIVTNGKTVWSYSASSNQVLVDSFRTDERSLTPERILTGAPEGFTPALAGKERLGTIEAYVVKLLPTDEQTYVKALKLWVDPDDWLIRKVELDDVSGKETVYVVSKFALNKGVPDSRFVFTPPPGADVVDMR